MTDYTSVTTPVQKLIDAAVAVKAAADAVVMKAKDDAYAALQTEFTAYKLTHPDTTPVPTPVPTPTPTPTPTPAPTGFPDATNTGPVAGTVFKAATGSMTISQAGTYSGLVVNGSINVKVPGVVIENSKLTGGGVFAENGISVTVRYCTIDGKGTGAAVTGIQAFGWFDRNNITGFENGIVVQAGKAGWAKGNFVHDGACPNSGAHYDGIAIQESVDGFVIDGNAVFWRDTSDVFLKGDFGPINNVTISNNLLRIQAGQETRTAYVINVDGRQQKITNLKVLNNKAQKAAFGYFTFDTVTGPTTVTGNTDYLSGKAVS